jgi:serine/threonine protein phosphatase PrpC
MNLVFQGAGKTDIGLVRTNNEDNFGFDLRRGIFIVCDGMGGAAAGEVASKIAVDTVLEYFRNDSGRAESPVLGQKFEGVSEHAAGLANAIQLANQAIQEAAAHNPNRSGMGSTIVAVCLHGMFFSIANVGDSRIYLICGGGIQQLTSDHSLVMEQVRRGLMTVEEAEKSEMQNVIVRALGSEDSVEPDLEDHEFAPGDVLESMQSCGVITLRPGPGAVPRLAGNPGANVEMRFPRCHSAHECEHRGNLDSVPLRSHLLLLHHSFGDNLVDCRLDEPGRDPLSRTVVVFR